ncbi:DUF3099 domain-containing protein [Rhodococcus opacus]|nr:DUF3099 domain-containing protein [Rhodococcus opacus]
MTRDVAGRASPADHCPTRKATRRCSTRASASVPTHAAPDPAGDPLDAQNGWPGNAISTPGPANRPGSTTATGTARHPISIKTASVSLEDQHRVRVRRYVIGMSLRTLAFVLSAVVYGLTTGTPPAEWVTIRAGGGGCTVASRGTEVGVHGPGYSRDADPGTDRDPRQSRPLPGRHTHAVLALARRRLNVLWAMPRDQAVYQPAPTAAAA